MQNLSEALETISTLFEQSVDNVVIGKLHISSKVSRKGVDMYKDKLKSGVTLDPVRVVKHPKEERYAVLDGNHKAHAHKEMGFLEIKCVIYRDPFGFLYFLTEQGMLQPPAFITDYFRIPLKRIGDNLRNLLMPETPNTSKYH